ncbi:hypothetical protein M8C21_013721 [Ambrosia artemisiifolia]|uniref:UBZ4-type domain-containing protein n=1 Tax=Ambrosia artemisiifolia TaxID=4212 RepID=A0AAD5DIU8_AMBAR|nr:hypothetical protein M8C21_013721 [Ambrosia artemisiifolia]
MLNLKFFREGVRERERRVLVTVLDNLLKTNTVENLEDTNNLFPNFSIREYVFESRSKDIARNWPFSDKSLQLCLNYGVKNLLPPFQSLDSVRNYPSISVCAVENRSPNEETISSINGKRNDKSQCYIEEDLDHTKSNSQPIVKKFKLVMKLNLGVESTEETAASKVCPVCKSFSSSSNTTLNAHIDSCLSEESSMKCIADLKLKTVKHRGVKPRKMRLMVDVYKTAHHCTIEELDRRNGANWATTSSFPDQELEFQAEEKNKEPQKPTYIPKVADHEGAVYIDKNGKKVRILSMPKVSNLDDDEAHVLKKGRKGSKAVIKKKNKKAYMQKSDKKILKLSHKSKKLSKRTESGRKENVAIKESCEKEDRDGGAKPIKAKVNEQMDDLAVTRRPWACSKRTGAAKRRFPMHTRRKEGTLLDDDDDDGCEDPISSKGSTLSSLKKSLSMPARRGHNDGSKLLNLKRKFSALGKSQDCSKQKQKPRTEEDTSKKMSFEMTNDVEVKTKKSMTSKSSNDDSSSEGLDIASESARTEDYIGIEPSFTGLNNSMDNQISKMISQLDNKFDSQQQRTLDDIIMEHTSEKQGNFFDEVDPIPIPGPPGSFLPPSPGADMGSEEEQQGNSSLTTMSRVQSSEDHRQHDFMNQDFISGSSISTVSSPSFARSADKLSARFDRNSVNNNNITSDLRSVDASFKEKRPTPCCCSRKEGAFFNNFASYRQESPVPTEHLGRTTESNRLRSELFPLANLLTLPPPEMVKPPAVTPTTPVLRLMGKNLTVVNTDNEQAKPPCWSPMGQYQQTHITFSHNQNGSMSQPFNLYPPNVSKSHSGLKSTTMENNNNNTATKEIIFIDDSSDNEGHDHHDHMFKETHAFSFANPYGNGSLQTSLPSQEAVTDGNRGKWAPTAYYPRSFS